MIKISLLGYGNLGQHLAHQLHTTNGIELVQVYSPSQTKISNQSIELINDLNHLKAVDLYVAAISDDAITEISQKLPSDYCLVHTSGTVAMDALAGQAKRGVFYPLQTFSKNYPVAFDHIPICLEANNAETMALLEQVAQKLSTKVEHIDSAQRLELHLGAVLVNNFTNHLYTLSQQHLEDQSIDFKLLHPLIEETTKKAITFGAKAAQTGPAKRGDNNTIERHLALLKDEKLAKLYNLLSDSIKEHSKSK